MYYAKCISDTPQVHWFPNGKLMQVMKTEQLLPTLRSYREEMVAMVVMEMLDLEDLRVQEEIQEPLEHRDLLDPGVGESLMSGGVEPPAQTQRELN